MDLGNTGLMVIECAMFISREYIDKEAHAKTDDSNNDFYYGEVRNSP